MNLIVRNTLAVIAGWLGGSIINMGLVKIGHNVIPIAGIDPNSMTELEAVMEINMPLQKRSGQGKMKKTYDDLDEILYDPDIQAVIIASPVVFHKKQVISATRVRKLSDDFF